MSLSKNLIAVVLMLGAMVMVAWPVITNANNKQYTLTPDKLSFIKLKGRGADVWQHNDANLHELYVKAIVEGKNMLPHYTITAQHDGQQETFIIPIAYLIQQNVGAYVQRDNTLYLYNCYRTNGDFYPELVLNNVTECTVNGLN